MDNNLQREQRATQAKRHLETMEIKYEAEILQSIRGSEIMKDVIVQVECSETPKVAVKDNDVISEIFEHTDATVTILNFASYKNPGGGFLSGAMAQEEAICHNSTLYNVISAFTDYYDWNNRHLSKGLYTNAAIWSPNIIVEKDGQIKKVNVITCAAPNNSLSIRFKRFTDAENTKALKSRISFIKGIAESKPTDVLILGAFGCGVFRQDAKEVATLFKEAFEKSNFKEIIHPVPSKSGYKNLNAFKEVFNQ